MPWTVGDVDKHKKGLTARQKRQWVEVANAARAKCLADGGNEQSCDASAIRQANGVVGAHEFVSYSIQDNSYTIRAETHQGRAHIVVPVIMMVEGVHAGSHGPLLHLAEDLGRFTAAWNGIPVVIGHPEDEGGYISANSPDVIDQEKVGTIFNTHMQDGKLKAEAWLDIDKVEAMSPQAMTHIREGKPLEVSVGVFTDEESVTGKWGDETYEAIARNHRPDHLALLPGGIGACNWEDGCGIRVNKGGEDVDEKVIEAKKLLSVEAMPQVNEQGYRELISAIQAKLDRMDDDAKVHYLTEVYDDKLVYEVHGREDGAPGSFYERAYSSTADGRVEFEGEPKEVIRKVEYVAVHQGMKRTKTNTKEVNSMEKKEEQLVTCQEKVEALIKAEGSTFTENDKTWLASIGDEAADKLIAMQASPAPVKEEDKGGEQKPLTKEEVIQALSDDMKDPEKFLSLIPDEMADQYRHGLKLHQEQRTKMIELIRNAEPDGYSEDELKGKKTEELTMILKYIKPQVNYAPLGGGGKETSEEVEPLLPTDVQAEIAANEAKQHKTAE